MERSMRRGVVCAWGLLLVVGCASHADPGNGGDDGGSSEGQSVKVTAAHADFVAFQDGDRDWTAVTGAGEYLLDVHAARYAVAIGCRASGTTFYYQSIEEARQLAVDGCAQPANPPDYALVQISVTNVRDEVDVYLDFTASTIGAGPTTALVTKGVHDPIAIRDVQNDDGSYNRIWYRAPSIDIERDQSISIDGNLLQPLEEFPVTIMGPDPLSGWRVTSDYITPHDGFFSFDGTATTYRTLSSSLYQPDDRLRVTVGGGSGAWGTSEPWRRKIAFQELMMPGPVTLAPCDIDLPVPVVVPGAVPQLSVTLPSRPSSLDYMRYKVLFTTISPSGSDRHLDMVVRPGWAVGATSVTLSVPDLRALAGWTDDLELYTDSELDWDIQMVAQDQPFDVPTRNLSGVLCVVANSILPDAPP